MGPRQRYNDNFSFEAGHSKNSWDSPVLKATYWLCSSGCRSCYPSMNSLCPRCSGCWSISSFSALFFSLIKLLTVTLIVSNGCLMAGMNTLWLNVTVPFQLKLQVFSISNHYYQQGGILLIFEMKSITFFYVWSLIQPILNSTSFLCSSWTLFFHLQD